MDRIVAGNIVLELRLQALALGFKALSCITGSVRDLNLEGSAYAEKSWSHYVCMYSILPAILPRRH
jgi:hypothetical protein